MNTYTYFIVYVRYLKSYVVYDLKTILIVGRILNLCVSDHMTKITERLREIHQKPPFHRFQEVFKGSKMELLILIVSRLNEIVRQCFYNIMFIVRGDMK